MEHVVREMLIGEYLGWEFAELCDGKSEVELEDLVKSFAFERCVKRGGLDRDSWEARMRQDASLE
jgi:hypothetical protein